MEENQCIPAPIVLLHGTCDICSTLSCLQLSFQEWTQQMRDMLDARKRGDYAFRDKDFKEAIECYSQVGMFLFAGK